MTSTFGEVSWTDNISDIDKKNKKDLFLRLDEGPNEVRLITQPFQYLVHKYKKEGDPGYGQKVYCSGIHGSCPLCSVGDKSKPRWLLGIISRKTGTYKILDISYAVFSQIRKYARNIQRWGDPMKYDLNIQVDKNGGATGYYAVQPIPKEPLSAADQVIKDNVDFDDLKRRVTPPLPEMVQKRIDIINGLDQNKQVEITPDSVSTSSSVTKTNKSTVNKTESVGSLTKAKLVPQQVSLQDDDEEMFPHYEDVS